MELVYGPDRSLQIEAFLTDELQVRMQQVTALRRLERLVGVLDMDDVHVFFRHQEEERDLARVLLCWHGDLREGVGMVEISYRRLFGAALLMRFAAGPDQPVVWPRELKKYLATLDLCAFLQTPDVDRWYRGLEIQASHGSLPAEARADWCRRSATWLVLERERVLETARTDPPPA